MSCVTQVRGDPTPTPGWRSTRLINALVAGVLPAESDPPNQLPTSRASAAPRSPPWARSDHPLGSFTTRVNGWTALGRPPLVAVTVIG